MEIGTLRSRIALLEHSTKVDSIAPAEAHGEEMLTQLIEEAPS